MKKVFAHLLFFIWTALSGNAQGTLTYDQESAAGSNFVPPPHYYYTPVLGTNNAYTVAQSFTPALSTVGFVRLAFQNIQWASGEALYVDLWSGSVGGTLLGTSGLVLVPQDWGGVVAVTNFFYASPIAVSPGTTYYLQPVLEGPGFSATYVWGGDYNYPGGEAFDNGDPVSGEDLWFQEGTYIVPEPCSEWLIFLGGCALFSFWRGHKRNPLNGKAAEADPRQKFHSGCGFNWRA